MVECLLVTGTSKCSGLILVYPLLLSKLYYSWLCSNNGISCSRMRIIFTGVYFKVLNNKAGYESRSIMAIVIKEWAGSVRYRINVVNNEIAVQIIDLFWEKGNECYFNKGFSWELNTFQRIIFFL